MKALIQSLVDLGWKRVRFLDLSFILLIGATAQMHMSFVSQMHYQTEKLLTLHHEDDEFINELMDIIQEMIAIARQSADAHQPGASGHVQEEAAINARIKVLEEALGGSPEKAGVGLSLRKDFDNLPERYKNDLALTREHVKKAEDQSRAIIVLMAGALIAAFVKPFSPRKE